MRTYYVFSLKEEILSLFQENAKDLYRMLRRIYLMEEKDLELGHNLSKQILLPIPKKEMDKRFYLDLHKELYYTKKGHDHKINFLYQDELSNMKVNFSHIKIESNKDVPSFFYYLHQNNYFVCDFQNKDYFFLNEMNVLTSYSKSAC